MRGVHYPKPVKTRRKSDSFCCTLQKSLENALMYNRLVYCLPCQITVQSSHFCTYRNCIQKSRLIIGQYPVVNSFSIIIPRRILISFYLELFGPRYLGPLQCLQYSHSAHSTKCSLFLFTATFIVIIKSIHSDANKGWLESNFLTQNIMIRKLFCRLLKLLR